MNPKTQYLVKENPDPERNDFVVEKHIIPPDEELQPKQPPSEWYQENGYFEGQMINHLNKALPKADAERVRESDEEGVTLEQMGDVMKVTEGELRDLIADLTTAKPFVKKT